MGSPHPRQARTRATAPKPNSGYRRRLLRLQAPQEEKITPGAVENPEGNPVSEERSDNSLPHRLTCQTGGRWRRMLRPGTLPGGNRALGPVHLQFLNQWQKRCGGG